MSVIHDFIYSFHMPLMFIISGYVHGKKEHFTSDQKFSGYLRKYAVDIYLPCIYFSFLYWLPKYFTLNEANNVENFGLTSLQDMFMIPIKGHNIYWFLCTLFFVKMIHLSLEAISKRIDINLLLWTILFVAAKFLNVGFIDDTVILSYGFYFHLGFIMMRKTLITESRHPTVFHGALLFAAGSALFLYTYFIGSGNAYTVNAEAIVLSLAMMTMFYALPVRNHFLSECGSCSMVIYVLHVHVIFAMRIIYRFLGLSASVHPSILFIPTVIVSVIIPLLVVYIYRHVKCFRWIEYIFYPGKLLRK